MGFCKRTSHFSKQAMELDLSSIVITFVTCPSTTEASRGYSRHAASTPRPGKRAKAFFTPHGAPVPAGDGQEVIGRAPVVQQSPVAATTRGTVSTTDIRQQVLI